ncbi:Cytochrome D ubiquinol oxidase subunit II, partial [Dysosmobacter welbionis]
RQLHQQIFRQGLHLRPVRDVGAHHQLHAGIRLAEAVVQPPVIDALVEVVVVVDGGVIDVCGGGDPAAVGRRGGNG